MTKKIQVTRPTKIELARLKRRLKLAARIQKIVKDRLSILVMEFLQTVRECATVKEKLIHDLAGAHSTMAITIGYHGLFVLEKEMLLPETTVKVNTGTRNVAGVRIPLFEIEETRLTHPSIQNMTDTSSLIDNAAQVSRKSLHALIELAELQNSLDLLGAEINKVKRINNALEYVVIPSLDATIRYLTMKFEERDREEVARLKHVKLLIEKRTVNAE